jgi:hypothetical protein
MNTTTTKRTPGSAARVAAAAALAWLAAGAAGADGPDGAARIAYAEPGRFAPAASDIGARAARDARERRALSPSADLARRLERRFSELLERGWRSAQAGARAASGEKQAPGARRSKM